MLYFIYARNNIVMNNYILLAAIVAAIFYAGQNDVRYGFGLLIALSIGFMMHINSQITEKDMEDRKKMIRDPRTRKIYYHTINE